jgi:cation diffusion facilitator family transporter
MAMPRRHARQASRRSEANLRSTGASRRTVVVALVANVVVAVTKLAGGALTASPALLAEGAHSIADTANQVFLLVSLSLSGRAADPDAPFGHGRERYIWTFVAAIGMFVAGAIFAVGYGVYELLAGGGEVGGYAIAWVTLAIAAIAEGASWVRALRQTRREAAQVGKSVWRFSRESRDPSVKMVLFEDSAALIGIALAAIGIGLQQVTGSAAWDAAAAIAIGVLLIAVAGFMAHDTAQLLTGAAAQPRERERIEEVLAEHRAIATVHELLTMVLGPNALLVAARVELADGMDSDQVERAADELDEAIRGAVPDVTEVFLDATPPRRATGAPVRSTRARAARTAAPG